MFIVNKKARSWETDVPTSEKTARKLGMVMHTANPSTQEVDTGEPGVQDHSQLPIQCEASLGYMKSLSRHSNRDWRGGSVVTSICCP